MDPSADVLLFINSMRGEGRERERERERGERRREKRERERRERGTCIVYGGPRVEMFIVEGGGEACGERGERHCSK